jgi:predicted translin family RNA/ssDNA-binding protein
VYHPCPENNYKWTDFVDQEHRVADRKERGDQLRVVRIQKYSGEYISAMVERDFSEEKDIFDKMTGNVEEINNPANARQGKHVSQRILHGKRERAEPSIRGRTLYAYKCVVHAGQ